MENKLISIITPMYNGEATIAQTIESVLNQTYPQWEMIIVDDCSTDNSAELVHSYEKKDNRIRYYRLETNSGVAAARNKAVEMARGRYLAFLDCDDLWYETKLEKQLNYMKEQKAVFCYTACEVIDEQGKKAGKTRKVPKTMDYQKLLRGNEIPCLTVLIDRADIMLPEVPGIHHEDYAFWLEILKSGVTAHGLNEVLAKYRINTRSVSGNKLRAALWTWRIYRKHQKLGVLRSIDCFIHYIIKGILKRI